MDSGFADLHVCYVLSLMFTAIAVMLHKINTTIRQVDVFYLIALRT